MVDATVSFAIGKLNDFLSQEVNTRRGVKDGVRWLKEELAYLQTFIRDAEAKQELDHLIYQWINNIREVANDIVVILERFSALQEKHADQKRGVLDRMRSLIYVCKKEINIYDIGKEIESLKGRVIEIKNRREEYGIDNILATPKGQQRKRTILRATSFENLVDVVGFEDDFNALLAELVRDDPSLKVISIHGMGGLGKTTLASKLYHSSMLNHFVSRAWVCASQAYNIKDVLKSIIKSFLGHELDSFKMDEVDLLRNLRQLLLHRDCYLVVIDDIWDIGVWEKIKSAFPEKKNGSRVIITTRDKKVAERVDDRCFVHELRFLREDESWQLFCKRTKPTHNLEKLAKEIVGKCRGLPLAIVVLSGLLLHKKSYEDWSKVKDRIWRELKGNSVEIHEILSLSYDELSFPVRQCFLYLARFPEDHVIDVQNLKLLWIAEEFITEDVEGDGVVMEDVAEDYLNELINHSMIQIAKSFWDGQVYECKVHDLLRDLAIQKATERKLLGIFEPSKQHPSPICLLREQPRHVIYNGIGKYLELLEPNTDDLKLRSLAVINQFGRFFKLEEMKVYTRFKYIKVLDLRGVESDGISKEIGDLVLLKFLGLVGGHISSAPLVIPRTIGRLKKLQTLCGSFGFDYEFPREICDLRELRHLSFFQGNSGGSLMIGRQQTKLQTLEYIRHSDWIQIDSVNLTNLHKLVISDDELKERSLESISNLTSLQTFKYNTNGVIPTIKPLSSCKRLNKVFLYGKIRDPSELCFLPDSVTYLTLSSSGFIQDPMPFLGSLTNLTALNLKYRVYMGEEMICCQDAFPNLQFLKLSDLPNLKQWRVEDGALSSLKGFQISYCNKLMTVPSQVTCVPPLAHMFI